MGINLIEYIFEIDLIKKFLNLNNLNNLNSPINLILKLIWIICWFIAIWIYHSQFFLMGLFCFILSILIVKPSSLQENQLPIVVSLDNESKTLLVEKTYNPNFNWKDIEICSGEAILPNGFIKKGDLVYNCKGNVSFRHIPTNILFGAYNFE